MLMKSKSNMVIVFLISLSLIFSACTKENTSEKESLNDPVTKREFFLGTVISITLYDNVTEEVFEKVFTKLKEIEDKMTINAENSEVIEINKNAGKDYVKVSDDTYYVINKGKYYSELSNGRFNISIGPLVKLWNIGSIDARVPSDSEINEKLDVINYKDVLLNESEKSVKLNKEGMILDLGGIAKGYGADVVVELLKDNGIKYGIVNLGGNVYTFGSKPNGDPWKIGIQGPFKDRGDYVGIVEIIDKTVVTSGIYERYFEEDGKLYHHILDPETGYPVENNLASVSIITDSSIDADSLSTAAFSLGLEKGLDLIESLENTEAIFITKDSEIYLTSGLNDNFELTDSTFKIK